MKLKINREQLVKIAVQGKVAHAAQYGDFEISHDGRAYSCPSTGGIVYNVKTGDNVFQWAGDHIEPGVSAILDENKPGSRANMGFNFLCCLGNTARIVSGPAKGARGVVTGHHGGVEHVILDFDDTTLRKMTLDDRILIEGYGQGLRLLDAPGVKIYSMDPRLLAKMSIRRGPGDTLEVPVTHVIPAALMGSGMGHNNVGTGDCDIMAHDEATVKSLKLDRLCFGDFVAVMDHDHSYGRTYRRGAVTIGVVIHSTSRLAGHGPGLTTVMTCPKGQIRPVTDARANLGRLLGIGRYRRRPKSSRSP